MPRTDSLTAEQRLALLGAFYTSGELTRAQYLAALRDERRRQAARDIAAIAGNVALVLAVVVGGPWAFYVVGG
jgi:hypothetical protein